MRISDNFFDILKNNKIVDTSYISLSVDAGTNETYNKIHAVKGSAKIYDKVLLNTQKLGEIRKKNYFDLSAAYLVNIHSGNEYDCEKFMNDFISAIVMLFVSHFPTTKRYSN